MISQEQLPNTFLFQRLKWVNEKFFCIYDCWSDKTKKISGLLCEAVIGTFDTEWKITITTTKSLVAALLQALTAFKQRRSSVFFKCVWYGSDAGSLCTVPNHNKRALDSFSAPNKSLCLFLHLPRRKCDIGCDTSTGLSAGQRPTSIQPHHNTSILRRLTLPTFCVQRSRLSLRCGPLRSDDRHDQRLGAQKQSPRAERLQGSLTLQLCLLSMHKNSTPSVCECVSPRPCDRER